jgi:hypothetical protein
MGIVIPLVIIRYFNVHGIFVFPSEADSIQVIDADAELALAISTELLEAIASRGVEFIHARGEAENLQLSERCAGDVGKLPASSGKPKLSRVFIRKGPDHLFSVARLTFNVKPDISAFLHELNGSLGRLRHDTLVSCALCGSAISLICCCPSTVVPPLWFEWILRSLALPQDDAARQFQTILASTGSMRQKMSGSMRCIWATNSLACCSLSNTTWLVICPARNCSHFHSVFVMGKGPFNCYSFTL